MHQLQVHCGTCVCCGPTPTYLRVGDPAATYERQHCGEFGSCALTDDIPQPGVGTWLVFGWIPAGRPFLGTGRHIPIRDVSPT